MTRKQTFLVIFRVNSSTVVTIRGLKATEEGKPASVKVSFKVKKTGKASKYTYASKVNVIDDKLTMTAAATKVKQITVNFNKVVDTTTTKLVVKKGAATPTVASTTFAADAKSAQIAMGTKLTAGTYTVEATVGEETLTADVVVEDEKLTKYELVSPNLVADATSTTTATIYYKALNQYDEMMVCDQPTVTCTFGKAEGADVGMASADKSGKIIVRDINPALTIPGTVGTIVLVDSKNGVNLQTSVTYQSKAFAASATVYGIYSKKTGKLIDGNLATGAKISDYAILMSVKDQYDGEMNPEAIKDSGVKVTFTAAPILTDLTLDVENMDDDSKFTEVSYEGASAFLVPLKSKDGNNNIKGAGTLSITMVSGGKGVIASPSFTIDEAKIIKTLSVAPASTLYAGVDNKLVVEAYDAAGNAITKYDDLNAAKLVAKSQANTSNGSASQETLTLKKNTDGTGTLYFNPKNLDTWGGNDNKKESTIATIVFTANSATSTDYLVKTINVTYYEKPMTVAVAGKGEKTITACAVSSSLKLDLKTLVYEDQYGNAVKVGDKPAEPATDQVSIYISKNDVFNGASERLVTGASDITGNNLVLNADKKGDATLYFRYGAEASAEKYDVKIPISATLVDDMVASDLKLVVNNGNAINASSAVNIVKYNLTETTGDAQNHEVDDENAYVYVTGVVNGKTVVLPSSQYTVITNKIDALGAYDAKNNAKTETKTVTVVVDSASGAQTLTADVTVSNLNSAITTLKESATGAVEVYNGGKSTAVTASDLIKAVKILDQYGNVMDGTENAKNFTYSITQTGEIIKEGTDKNEIKVTHPSTQEISIELPTDDKTYTADVTITTKDGKITFTKSIKMTTT